MTTTIVCQDNHSSCCKNTSTRSSFLAAKVSAEAGIESGDVLSPLQMSYTEGSAGSSFTIPIRIGTLNAKDAQDLIIYAVSDYNRAAWDFKLPNLPLRTNTCGYQKTKKALVITTAQFKENYEEANDASWTVEYAWGGGGCDPCSLTPRSGRSDCTWYG